MRDGSLDLLRSYGDSVESAGKRTRGTVLILTVACVLGLAGFLNSSKHGWMRQRIAAVTEKSGDYVTTTLKLDPKNNPKNSEEYKAFVQSIIRSYVEKSFSITVPFFGATFDVNDLGLLVGIGLTIILLMLWYGLKSERRALVLGFRFAKREGLLEPFYSIHAGRQVLVTPPIQGQAKHGPTKLVAIVARFFIQLFPAMVYTLIAVNDFCTSDIGNTISPTHTKIVIAYTAVLWVAIIWVGLRCWMEWLAIDRIWEKRNPWPAERDDEDDA